jgi:hypothetical protein
LTAANKIRPTKKNDIDLPKKNIRIEKGQNTFLPARQKVIKT